MGLGSCDINIPFDDRCHGNEMISNSFLSKKRAPNLVMTGVKTLGFFMNVSERNTRSVKIGMLESTTPCESPKFGLSHLKSVKWTKNWYKRICYHHQSEMK